MLFLFIFIFLSLTEAQAAEQPRNVVSLPDKNVAKEEHEVKEVLAVSKQIVAEIPEIFKKIEFDITSKAGEKLHVMPRAQLNKKRLIFDIISNQNKSIGSIYI